MASWRGTGSRRSGRRQQHAERRPHNDTHRTFARVGHDAITALSLGSTIDAYGDSLGRPLKADTVSLRPPASASVN